MQYDITIATRPNGRDSFEENRAQPINCMIANDDSQV